jgi:hypothetical protein
MSIVDLFEKLSSLNLKVKVTDGNLFLSGDENLITSEIVGQLRHHKLALIDMLEHKEHKSSPVAGNYPLSLAQEEIFSTYLADSSTLQFNLCSALILQGELEKEAIEKATRLLFDKHESLRTRYFVSDDHEYIQNISELEELPISWCWSLFNCNQNASAIEEACLGFSRLPFDLSADPMLKLLVMPLTKRKFMLAMLRHHISTDGWSFAILVKDFCTFYNSVINQHQIVDDPAKSNYIDYVLEERSYLKSSKCHEQRTFWEHASKSRTVPPILLKGVKNESVEITGISNFELDGPIVHELKCISQRCRGSLYTVLLTIFNLTLLKDELINNTGKHSISMGTDVNLRNSMEFEDTVGLFVNRLPLVFLYDSSETIFEAMTSTTLAFLEFMDNKQLPFQEITRVAAGSAGAPKDRKICALFGLHNNPHSEFKLQELQIEQNIFFPPSFSNIPITLYFTDVGSGLIAELIYQKHRVSSLEVDIVINTFKKLTQHIICNPDDSLLSSLRDIESQLKADRNARRKPFSTIKKSLMGRS